MDARTALAPRAQRPVAAEPQRTAAVPLERLGEAQDVLAFGQRAHAQKARALAVGTVRGRLLGREPAHVDAAVDDLRPDAGQALEPSGEVLGVRDHAGGT